MIWHGFGRAFFCEEKSRFTTGRSKRGSSTAQADAFARKRTRRQKRRLASVGMTTFLDLLRWLMSGKDLDQGCGGTRGAAEICLWGLEGGGVGEAAS
jgi:hypothetical protein